MEYLKTSMERLKFTIEYTSNLYMNTEYQRFKQPLIFKTTMLKKK